MRIPNSYKLVTAVVVVFVVGLLIFHAKPAVLSVTNSTSNSPIDSNNSPMPTPVININVTDITVAGFSGVVQQQPSNGRFPGPNLYFTVQQNIPNSPNGNILMVLVTNTGYLSTLPSYGSNIKPFNLSGGTGQEGTMLDGRTAIDFIKNMSYVVIMGPGVSEIEKLAQIIGAKL